MFQLLLSTQEGVSMLLVFIWGSFVYSTKKKSLKFFDREKLVELIDFTIFMKVSVFPL